MDNITSFKKITAEMTELYERKNKDYGDSFSKSMNEDGLLVLKIRLGDKYNRFCNLLKADKQEVNDESIEDTLKDLANYAIMGLIWMSSKGTTLTNKVSHPVKEEEKHTKDSYLTVPDSGDLDIVTINRNWVYLNGEHIADIDMECYNKEDDSFTLQPRCSISSEPTYKDLSIMFLNFVSNSTYTTVKFHTKDGKLFSTIIFK